jgi:lipopolysaccharide transport system permease protein
MEVDAHARTRALRALITILLQYLLLVGAFLVAFQMRIQLIAYGPQLPGNYPAINLPVLAVLLAGLISGNGIVQLAHRLRSNSPSRSARSGFLAYLLGGIISSILSWQFLPILDDLHLLYFLGALLFLGYLTMVLPHSLRPAQDFETVRAELVDLWTSRQLLSLWLKFNIKARYTQTILGILWIILLPLATSIVVAIAFTQIMRFNAFGANVPAVAFIMSGIVPFSLFQTGVLQTTQAAIANMTIINKVYFPREILIINRVGEAIVDFGFAFLALLVVDALVGIWPTWRLVWLILPLVILIAFVLALGFFFSVWSAFVRDIPQLIGVLMQLLFYLTPIIYPFEIVPEGLRFLVLLNPVTPIVQSFRDIVVLQQPPDIVSLYYPMVISFALLVPGYSYFKSRQGTLSDMV